MVMVALAVLVQVMLLAIEVFTPLTAYNRYSHEP